ncbi:hypothetical protein QTP88_021344 [Uroleucon formosanum]
MGLKFNINPLLQINATSYKTKVLPATSNKIKKMTVKNKKILQALGLIDDATKVKLTNNGYLFEQIRLEINGIEVDSTRVLEITSSLKGYLSESYYEKSIRNPILSLSTFLSNALIIVIDTSKQNDSATASAVDVQLEIEASESLTGVTAYCFLIHDRILEYVPFTREVRKLV